MKLLIVLALVVAAIARPDDSHYDAKFDNFNIDELMSNDRLLKNFAHCLIGDGKCTAEAKEIKKLMPEAVKTTCAKCTEKQKSHIAKGIKAIETKLPTEYEALKKITDPDGQYTDNFKDFIAKYSS